MNPTDSVDSNAPSPADPNLIRSMGDAACFGGMVGCGETYFAAFALAVGMSETAAGLVASIPLLVGGVIQMVSPMAIQWIGGLRRWIVVGATLQSLAFVPLAMAAWNGSLSLGWMLLIASVYWAAGLSTGPAWNTWIEAVVPPTRRASFFARRSRLQQGCTFVALMVAGMFLHWMSGSEKALVGFAVLFVVAGVLRLSSAWFLHRTRATDGSWLKSTKTSSTAGGAASVPTSPPDAEPTHIGPAIRLLAYLVAMQVFIQLSGPYFVPYMLGQLNFTYAMYVGLVALAFLSKIISLSFLGRVAERSGAPRLLWLGGIGLVPLASLWMVSNNLYWLALVQIISGVAWAAYELGFFLMFFEMLPANQRTRLLTLHNLANSVAICIGALTGAAILSRLGCEASTYHTLFGLSSIGRLLCLLILAGAVLPRHSLKRIQMRILSVRPGAGTLTAPVLASAEEQD